MDIWIGSYGENKNFRIFSYVTLHSKTKKLSFMVFNGARAKTKTVLEMACKKEQESSPYNSASDRLGHSVSHYSTVQYSKVFVQ